MLVVGSCLAAIFSWKRTHILQNKIDVVIKVGLWLRLPIDIIPYINLKCLEKYVTGIWQCLLL